ncbi:MAG TPA: long-chain fatty acid--CoA ligase [Spirochaetia bacterium]|nr:long-chain fatty acid--CoA ligase [Spirochaetales bacterium]HPD81047.1 long-chain fatty acid--CoA ligase [Spirochaetales bacterium]HQK34539.1 long-chain fatty acid--CoA ligase [Spirochaetales bacterium]HRS64457.1 long-chain fatty acid--CoA ligase [Spirochaetia bacterium]HRV27325.1 long-chain fatty acid--CoA ligase [Spirochaetia bacterium]
MAETIPQLFLEKAQTIPDMVMQYSKKNGKDFSPTTYREMAEEVATLAAGFLEIGLQRGDNIGFISDNRKEWLICDLAVTGLGAIDVPRGCDTIEQDIAYILSFSECKFCITENDRQIQKILARKDSMPLLKTIICIDPPTEAVQKSAQAVGLTIHTYAELFEKGTVRRKAKPGEYEHEVALGKNTDTVTIIFTSGTTGEPKGVMLCHRNFLFQIEAFPKRIRIKEGQIWLSVLPIWHSLERAVNYAIIGVGATIAYSKPVGQIMLADLVAIKPQWMVSVPRIWESVLEGVYRNIRQQNQFKQKMFNFFVGVSKDWANFRNLLLGRLPNFGIRARIFDILIALLPFIGLAPLRGLAEILVFKKIKAKLGGKFVAGISGGGALPYNVDTFFDAIGIKILEGYGLTETAPVVTLRSHRRPVIGTVGAPLDGTEVKIVDEHGKTLGHGKKGVVLIRGPQVMQGYYKKPDLTKKVIDDDGWFNSGDIGMLTKNNELKLTGRAKDTIVLRGGENVEPVPLENKLKESQYIKQVVILGQDKKYLAALIVPDQDMVIQWAKDNNIPFFDYEELINQPEIRELIDYEINSLINIKNGFRGFERIFKFKLLLKPFEVDRELSAKQEVKRHVINELYKKEIDDLFEE